MCLKSRLPLCKFLNLQCIYLAIVYKRVTNEGSLPEIAQYGPLLHPFEGVHCFQYFIHCQKLYNVPTLLILIVYATSKEYQVKGSVKVPKS